MRSVQEIVEFQLQRLLAEVRADQPPAVARVTVEKTTPELISTNIEVEVQLAPKVAKRRRSASFTKRGLERAMRAAQAVGIPARIEVVGEKITVITDNKPTGAAVDTEVNLFDIEAERLRRSKGIA